MRVLYKDIENRLFFRERPIIHLVYSWRDCVILIHKNSFTGEILLLFLDRLEHLLLDFFEGETVGIDYLL